MALALQLESIRFGYGTGFLFDGFDLTVGDGEILAILGPNGTGKTTLLRLASGALHPTGGSIRLFGQVLSGVPHRERARIIAVVPQDTHLLFDFTVEQVVRMGRSPHLGLLGIETARDRSVAREAMARTGVDDLGDRLFHELSGGERQRVIVARALAQEPRILLLDEPTTHLDLRHQVLLYEILSGLNRDSGMTILLASHDVNLAARYCRRVVLVKRGRTLADGTPSDALAPATLREAYGVNAEVRSDPLTGGPWIVPLGPA